MDRELYEHKARIIKALAHPTRLAMVEALAEGERCVCELQTLVGCDLSTVSRHLALLRSAGIVTARKQGLQVFYRLQVPCIISFLGCVDEVLQDQAQTRQRLAALVR